MRVLLGSIGSPDFIHLRGESEWMLEGKQICTVDMDDLFIVDGFRKGQMAIIDRMDGSMPFGDEMLPIIQMRSNKGIVISLLFDPNQLPLLRDMVDEMMKGGE
jgi:hypothetical protein